MQVDNTTSSPAIPSAERRDLDRLREITGKVVGSVFYGAMLKASRESKLKGAYGHGGRGEEVFSAQLHGLLAERMGTQTNQGIVNTLYQHLSKQQSLISNQAGLYEENPR